MKSSRNYKSLHKRLQFYFPENFRGIFKYDESKNFFDRSVHSIFEF